MKPSRLVLAIAVAAFSAAATAAETPVSPQAGGTADAMPRSAEEWVRYLSDFTRNTDMLVDPKKFLAALQTVSEPGFMLAAINAMSDPNLYMQSVASMMDPRAYANYARTMDPAAAAAWAQALQDPRFFGALVAVMADAAKMSRWMMTPLDPKVPNLAMKAVDPNLYARWGTAPLDPRLMGTASAPMNPNWYGAWASTMANPGSYAPSMSPWMMPTMPNAGYPAPAFPTPAFPFPYPMMMPPPVAAPGAR
jgi:hypothetical protein